MRRVWTIPPLPYPTLIPSLGRLSGSYEDLQRGQVSEALVDFTGGVTMTINLVEAPCNLWDILTRAIYSRTLIGCQTHAGVRWGCALAGWPPPLAPGVGPQIPPTPKPRVLMFKP